jgi:hypothetical protein
MLSAYYKLLFSWKGKRVERLKFFQTRSRTFRRSLDTLVNAKSLQDSKRGDRWRKVVRLFLFFGILSSAMLILWIVWESRWVFEIY